MALIAALLCAASLAAARGARVPSPSAQVRAPASRYTDAAQADLVKGLPGWDSQGDFNIFSG